MAGKRKRDARRNNGKLPTGDNESQVLVSGPAELIAAVAARAKSQGIPVREAWRRAARTWLSYGQLTPEDRRELEG